MFVHRLQLTNFRNYLDQRVELTTPKVILVGDNAQGKSNFLEALQLLASGRTYRASRDRELIRQGMNQARIVAQVERREGEIELELILRQTGQRSAKLNGLTQTRLRALLGQLNVVFFSSLDLDLVRGGPQERRHWLDGVLIQLEPVYAQLLDHYEQTLHQRNALLKQHRQSLLVQAELPLWDEQLVRSGTRLIRRRRRLIQRLGPLADHWQGVMSGGQEQLSLVYMSKIPLDSDDPQLIQEAFFEQLAARNELELLQGTTLVGPHRDEIALLLGETPARMFGSQGQQRTLVLALKLAELTLIEEINAQPPLLLLDDVLAELDLHRQNLLLSAIGERIQTFVTTTHLGAFDQAWLQRAGVWRVQQGQLSLDPSF